VALGVVEDESDGTVVGVTEAVALPEGVPEALAPGEKVGVVVGVAVRGKQAPAEAAPVALVVKPAPQAVQAARPAASA
jgi:hypothetical protein